MKQNFMSYGFASKEAAKLALYFGSLGYQVVLSLGSDMRDIVVRVFHKPNEELHVPAYYLYTRSEISQITDEEENPEVDINIYYFEY